MHGLLLGMEFKGLKKKSPDKLKAHVMSMTLAYLQPKKPKPKPVLKKQVSPIKKPAPVIKKNKKKLVTKPKPQKTIVKQKKIIKPNAPPVEKKPPEKIIKPKKIVNKIAPPENKQPPKIIPDHKPLFAPKPFPDPEPLETPKKTALTVSEPTQNTLHKEIASTTKKEHIVPLEPVIREAIPRYRENPPPKYPRIARRRGYQGTTILEVLVDKDGNVGDSKIFKSSGYKVLDRSALASVKNWSFEPGMKNEDIVEMWVKVPIRFQLK